MSSSRESVPGEVIKQGTLISPDIGKILASTQKTGIHDFQFHHGSIGHSYSKFQDPILSQSVPRTAPKKLVRLVL